MKILDFVLGGILLIFFLGLLHSADTSKIGLEKNKGKWVLETFKITEGWTDYYFNKQPMLIEGSVGKCFGDKKEIVCDNGSKHIFYNK